MKVLIRHTKYSLKPYDLSKKFGCYLILKYNILNVTSKFNKLVSCNIGLTITKISKFVIMSLWPWIIFPAKDVNNYLLCSSLTNIWQADSITWWWMLRLRHCSKPLSIASHLEVSKLRRAFSQMLAAMMAPLLLSVGIAPIIVVWGLKKVALLVLNLKVPISEDFQHPALLNSFNNEVCHSSVWIENLSSIPYFFVNLILIIFLSLVPIKLTYDVKDPKNYELKFHPKNLKGPYI